jgi:hypothetical protein
LGICGWYFASAALLATKALMSWFPRRLQPYVVDSYLRRILNSGAYSRPKDLPRTGKIAAFR